MVLNICFSSFYFGYIVAYLGSFKFDTIINFFNVTIQKDTAEGLITGMVPIGGGIGALSSFFLLKYFSRK
jgi:hypothetical protein